MRILLLVFLNAILISLNCIAQYAGTLVNLPVGFKCKTEITGNLVVEQEFMGIRYNTQMGISTGMHLEVTGIDSSEGYILSAYYTNMKISVISMMVNMEVNSETYPSGDSLSIVLGSLKDKTFDIFLSRKGEITDISGLDEMIMETVGKSYLPAKQKNDFSVNLVQSLGKEAVMDYYRSNSIYYPGYDLHKSDEWDLRLDIVNSGIPMGLESRVKVKEADKKTLLLSSEGRLSLQGHGAWDRNENASGKAYKLSGAEITEVEIDVRTGLIIESTSSRNITGSLRALAGGEIEDESLIPFKIISRSSVITSFAE